MLIACKLLKLAGVTAICDDFGDAVIETFEYELTEEQIEMNLPTISDSNGLPSSLKHIGAGHIGGCANDKRYKLHQEVAKII